MKKKGEQRRLKIIESATYCLANFGERGTTFQAIADHCHVSQPLVVRYLKKRENIFPTILEYWVVQARRKTEEALLQTGSPEDKLCNYLRVSMEIFKSTPEISKIYLMLHYFAGISERYRLFNTQIKEVAVARIAAILEEGCAQGVFSCEDPNLTARVIHSSLVGFLISSVTEVAKKSDLKLPGLFEETCLKFVKKK